MIDAVRNVAGNGRTVMVTIHQPSIEIFEAFDRLVLLAMGGAPIFSGELGTRSSSLVEYFQVMFCTLQARQISVGEKPYRHPYLEPLKRALVVSV